MSETEKLKAEVKRYHGIIILLATIIVVSVLFMWFRSPRVYLYSKYTRNLRSIALHENYDFCFPNPYEEIETENGVDIVIHTTERK